MGLPVKPETILFCELERELPCEDPDHDRVWHRGNGKWYLKVHCPLCGYNPQHWFLVCEDLMTYIEQGGTFTCAKCEVSKISGFSIFTIMGKR